MKSQGKVWGLECTRVRELSEQRPGDGQELSTVDVLKDQHIQSCLAHWLYVAIKHLNMAHVELRYAVNIKYALNFKDLVWKKEYRIPHL